MLSSIDKLDRFKNYAPIGIRFIFFLYLILAFKAQSFMPSNIEQFASRLAKMNWPLPTLLAYVGSWSVFLGYILIVIGFKTRWACIPVVVYFLVAVFAFHVAQGHGISDTMSATVLLMSSLFLLINGAGKPSVDEGW